MRNCVLSWSLALGGAALVSPVGAEDNLLGQWSGTSRSVVINPRYAPPSPFAATEDTDNKSEMQFVEAQVTVVFEEQRDDLAIGKWASGQENQKFVCAQLSVDHWDCIDANARVTFRTLSEKQLKVCYLHSSARSQVAACAELSKSE